MRRIGVDIGGTFTDVVLFDGDRVFVAKVLSDKKNPVSSIRAGVIECMQKAGCAGQDIDVFVHGTTIGTNAVLERRGASPVLLTTKGFRDSLELGTLKRPNEALYNLKFMKPRPLVERSRRYEVKERIGAQGNVVERLDDAEIERVVGELAELGDVQSVAICLFFSFRNPDHERRLAEAIRAALSNAFVVVSSEVLPVIKEYERASYTALCAYLGPLVARYLTEMRETLGVSSRRGYFIMQSHDGLRSIEASIAKPANIVLSGPAAGVIGARLVGERSGQTNVISLDIGGTSTDVSLIEKAATRYSTEKEIDHIPLTVPMVDIHTIGAGGGSKVWIDSAGGLRVGPQSTGSTPGPACYGQGGTEPSVTDADVILGYLNPDVLLDGEKKVFKDLAEEAFGEVGQRLGISIIDAARGAVRIFVNAVQGAIRVVSIQRGLDPREFSLVAFGGAGPTHSCEVADELGITRVIVPPYPGVTSAFGLLAADVSHDAVQMIEKPVAGMTPDALRAEFDLLAQSTQQKMSEDGVPPARIERSAELRFPGQLYSIAVPISDATYTGHRLMEAISADFSEQHKVLYGFTHAPEIAEIYCIRVNVSGDIGGGWSARLSTGKRAPRDGHGKSSRRIVTFIAHEPVSVPVYRRDDLATGSPLQGPAVIEQYDTNTVVPPNWTALQEASGNLVLSKGRRS